MKTIIFLFIVSVFINGVFGDEVKSVSVMEGDSLTLQTDVPDIQTDNDLTLTWTFGSQKDTSIAHINRAAKTTSINDDVLNGRFRDRLKMNNQTGDLTITNITTEDSGVYNVRIHVKKKIIEMSFNVKSVNNPESEQLKSVLVKDGDSVTLLTDVHYFKKYDEIQWRFQEIPIAEFNKSVSKISEDERFRDKMQLDVQTGSLQINHIRTDLSGLYEVDLTSSSSGYTIHQSFTVTVSGEVKSVSAINGDPLTINTDVPDIKSYDQILLIFGCDDRIAEVNKQNKQFTLYGRIRDRLTLNDQTGDLTITNIKNEDAGDYELKMSSRRRSIQRRFRVNVSERGLSPGAIAGISVFILLLLAAAAAGVIYYRRKIAEAMKQMVTILEVDEGKSVDLKTKVTDIKRVDVIEWRFEKTLIAEINPANNIFSTSDGDDDEFRDQLKLNHQTGDLTINDIRWEHSGVYTLKIIRDGETSDKRFSVFVRCETETLKVDEWTSADLKTKVKDIKTDDVIEWRFGFNETLIAEINPANNIFSTYNGDYGLFRDKLKLNDQTGDLNIKDTRWEHNGDYLLKIIRDGETSYRRFRVFFYRNTLPVYEGESVYLKTEVKDIKRDDLIEWRFEETLIAEINPANNIFSTSNDDLFRYKLMLNHQTGDLIIKDIRQKHTGLYKLRIIRDGKTSDKIFSVFIRYEIKPLQVYEGESVNLKTEVKDIKRVDLIEWRFGDDETLIAEINPAHSISSTYDGDDDLFRDKLKLNPQTGDLNISDIRWEHTGVYRLKIIRDGEISYRRFSVSVKWTTLQVYEGKSVNLKTKVTDIQGDEKIEWRFGDDETLIAEINPANNIFSTYDDDDLFRDKLTLNPQTGDLNINDIRWEHSGVYKLKIIRDGKTSYRRFNVLVREKTEELKVYEGKSADLKTEVKDIKRVDLIEWRFGETLIAEINPANNIFSTYDGDKGLFRDKLKLNDQTGDLTINNSRKKHNGVYKLRIIRDGKTSYRRFSVFVRGTTETLQVDGGESVDLKTKVTDIQKVEKIEWRFEETLIATINPVNKIFSTSDGDYGEFKDKLKLDHQTGDLNIKDIRQKHKGVYKLKITRDGEISHKSFEVIVRSSKGEDSARKREEDSVRIEMQPLLPNNSQ